MKLWSASKLQSRLRPSSLIPFAIVLACGFALWTLINAWRYETHPLSRNSYVLEDRLAGRVYYCHFASCRTAGSTSAAEQSDTKARTASPLPVAPSASSAEDWSRLNDDEFMARMLELTRNDQGPSPARPQE